MSFEINSSIFREYDIRGIAGKDIHESFAEYLGVAYARFAEKRLQKSAHSLHVSVGWDCRLTSPSYSEALVRGLLKGGLKVTRLGTCATPLTYFSLFHLGLDGGIMITGSHNPAEYNGFKIGLGKGTLHGADIQELKKEMLRLIQDGIASLHPTGEVQDFPIIPAYWDHIQKIARPVVKKKVVLDAGNGTAGSIAPELFRRLGAEVVPLYCELDGRFPNHHPDPTVPAHLKDLIAKVRETGADFGVGFDGDSDRIGLVDETGRILFGDELMVLFSRDILAENKGATIISEVKSSYRLFDDIAAHGGKPLMWKTGHSLIKAKMKETHALLAGEMSGHIFFADRYFGYDDAIYAAVRVLEIASKAGGRPISALIADLPKTVATPEIRDDCEEEKKFELVSETKRILQMDRHSMNDIDGIRIDFGQSWGLIRASNTQPVLVLRFEGSDETTMMQARSVMEGALHAAARKIGHPDLNTHSSAAH